MMRIASLAVQDVGSKEVDIMSGTPRKESQSDIMLEILIRELEGIRTNVDAYNDEVGKVVRVFRIG